MEEETKSTQTGVESAHDTPEDIQHSGGSESMTFDQMLDSNPAFRSEFDRRNTKAVQTARSRWEQEQADSRDEAKKLARMTETERRAYQLEQGEKQLAQRMAEFDRRQLVVQTGEELGRRGLPSSMAKWLVGNDADTTKANIDAYEQDFRAAVQNGVNGAMRGKAAPSEPRKPAPASRESLKGMSRAEIVKAYDEGRFNELLGRK